jgi:hypothetical protein
MIANLRGPEKNPDLSETARQRLVDERKAWEDRLTDLAAKAHQRRHGPFEEEPLSVMFAPVRARRAIEFYISEKAYETGLPHLRKILKAANKFSTKAPSEAIVRFCRLAGTTSDAVPPFAQMRALFCYGDPSSNGLESNDADEIRRHQEREDIWTASLSPAVLLNGITKVGQEALGEALAQWLALTRELHEMTGKGRSPIAAEINFVAALAHYWRHEVKAVMGNSRSKNYCSDEPWRQRGLFADFVRASAELIPPEYRPHSWDRAIRSVLQQSP